MNFILKFFRKIKPLKPGTYEARLRDVKPTKQGYKIILDNIKEKSRGK